MSGSTLVNTGAIYNLATNQWTAVNQTNAPESRSSHTAIWTGTRMIVWGGYGAGTFLSTGALYDVTTNQWVSPTSTTNAPQAPGMHSSIWAGSRMIIFGGSLPTAHAYIPP